MKKLTKQQEAEKADHARTISAKYSKVEEAISAYNSAMAGQSACVIEAINDLNGAIADADQWRCDIHGTMEQYEGDRSDKWREGEGGERYNSWMESWAEELASVDEVEFEELEVPDCSVPEDIENLPDNPE